MTRIETALATALQQTTNLRLAPPDDVHRFVDGVIVHPSMQALAALVEAAEAQVAEWHDDEVHSRQCNRPICVSVAAFRAATEPQS